MTTQELRDRYTAELFETILADPTPFYDAFDEGETGMNDFLTQQWEIVCQKAGASLGKHPFFPDIAFWLLDETEEQFACMMVAALPPLPGDAADALLVSTVFGATMDPRCFSGVRRGDAVTVTEYSTDGAGTARREVGSFPDGKERQREMAETVYAICDRYGETA